MREHWREFSDPRPGDARDRPLAPAPTARRAARAGSSSVSRPRKKPRLTMLEQLERANAWAELATKEAALANERLTQVLQRLDKIWLTLHPEERVLSQHPHLTSHETALLHQIHQEGKPR
jgi:hypothetical protein